MSFPFLSFPFLSYPFLSWHSALVSHETEAQQPPRRSASEVPTSGPMCSFRAREDPTMKKNLTLYKLSTLFTPNGARTSFHHPEALCAEMGGAKTIRVQMYGRRRSDANAYVDLKFYET